MLGDINTFYCDTQAANEKRDRKRSPRGTGVGIRYSLTHSFFPSLSLSLSLLSFRFCSERVCVSHSSCVRIGMALLSERTLRRYSRVKIGRAVKATSGRLSPSPLLRFPRGSSARSRASRRWCSLERTGPIDFRSDRGVFSSRFEFLRATKLLSLSLSSLSISRALSIDENSKRRNGRKVEIPNRTVSRLAYVTASLGFRSLTLTHPLSRLHLASIRHSSIIVNTTLALPRKLLNDKLN